MKEKDIYRMMLHETITLQDNEMEVTRVCGGWVYRSTKRHFYQGNQIGGSQAAVFVPDNRVCSPEYDHEREEDAG